MIFLSNYYINIYTYYTIFTEIYGSQILSKKSTYQKKKKGMLRMSTSAIQFSGKIFLII